MRIDYRVIKKKTGCTDEQAQYLAVEIRKLPKLQEQIMRHLHEVNLYNCTEVKLVRLYNYYDTSCNICGYRQEGWITRMYKFGFDNLFEDMVFKEVI